MRAHHPTPGLFPVALGATLGLAAGLAPARPAHAYCRTNTCESESEAQNPACAFDSRSGCVTGGRELFWNKHCLSVSVHAAGSVRRGIDYEQAAGIVDQAFQKWTNVDCGAGAPSLSVTLFPAVACNQIEYNQNAPNANAWVFRDEGWPDESAVGADTLALTTVTFNLDTGEIYDADVEINSYQNQLTASTESDPAAIATHEAGHVLGLAHSWETGATMYAFYTADMAELSNLGRDDTAGICDAFPTEEEFGDCDPAPYHGFSPACGREKSGCSLSGAGPGSSSPWAWLLVAVGAVALARRRSS